MIADEGFGSDAMLRVFCVVAIASLPVTVAGFPDNPIEARRADEARRLGLAHLGTWVSEITGFNQRNASCTPDQAQSTAAEDATHRASFNRTLGWRFDSAGARWMPVASAQAEVTLTYSGPVRTGIVTIEGKVLGFCRAEAPDKMEVTWMKLPDSRGGIGRIGLSLPLPTLAPGFDAGAGALPPPVPEAPTPRSEIDARIAKAGAMLAQDVAGLDTVLAASREASLCAEDKARAMAQSSEIAGETSTRTDGPVSVSLTSRSYSGPVKQGDRTVFVCGALSPQITIAATTRWQAEGSNELSFTIDAQGKP